MLERWGMGPMKSFARESYVEKAAEVPGAKVEQTLAEAV
jgi:hypothetical protein